MGDADTTQMRMPVQELEDWMDDTLSEMDDGMSRIFSLMNILDERSAQIMSEICAWQTFRRCFTALNIFVVPIVLSIGIAYGTTGMVQQNSNSEAVLQMMIMCLMYLSGCIGFPLYFFALWEAYFADNSMGSAFSKSNDESENDDGITDDDLNRLIRMSVPEERYSEINRFLNRRRDSSNLEPERRSNQSEEVETTTEQISTFPRNREMPESCDNVEIPPDEKFVDLDSDFIPDATDALSKIISTEMSPKEQNDSYGVKVIILNANKDLSVEIEKDEQMAAPLEESKDELEKNKLLELTNVQFPGIRNIVVENVGEGDNRHVSSKGNDSLL